VINFGVIVFVLHGAQVPGDRGELALLFLVAFTTLLLTGPGRYSLDQRLGGKRNAS
jgi:putative oxidoreductase